MTDDEARARITRWAKQHFYDEDEEITPDVDIVSLAYHPSEDEWEAELSVSTSADNPTVTFFHDEQYGLQIVAVEY